MHTFQFVPRHIETAVSKQKFCKEVAAAGFAYYRLSSCKFVRPLYWVVARPLSSLLSAAGHVHVPLTMPSERQQ